MPMANKLKITLVRSTIGRHYRQKRTIEALGFKVPSIFVKKEIKHIDD